MFLTVAGRRLEARRIAGPAPELVFLHEGLGSVGLWRDFPDRVCAASGRGGLVYSRAGYGASDPVPLPRPPTYLDDEAHLVPAVLDAAGIDRAVLIGHSDGASIALAAAAVDSPAAVARAAAGATAGGLATDGAAGGGVAGRILGVGLLAPHVTVEDDNVEAIRETGERYRTTDLRDRLARHHSHVDVAFAGWHDAWTDPRFRRWSLLGVLADVRVPVLVVQGTADPYGTLDQAHLVADGVAGPVEVLALDGCGHTPQRERPDETFTALVGLVQRVVAAAR